MCSARPSRGSFPRHIEANLEGGWGLGVEEKEEGEEEVEEEEEEVGIFTRVSGIKISTPVICVTRAIKTKI